jgi:hypothetical protein
MKSNRRNHCCDPSRTRWCKKTLFVERGAQLGGAMTTGGVAFPGLFDV